MFPIDKGDLDSEGEEKRLGKRERRGEESVGRVRWVVAAAAKAEEE